MGIGYSLMPLVLDAYSSIERPEDVAAQERQLFPVRTGKYFRSRPAAVIALFGLNGQVQSVQIRFAQSSLCDLQQLCGLKLFEVGADAPVGGAHIVCELDLAGKAGVIVPCIFEQHGVRELGANGYVLFCKNEIWDLGEAVTRCKIGAHDFDIALFENVADVAFGTIIHTLSLYAARNALSPCYPRLLDTLCTIPLDLNYHSARRRRRDGTRHVVICRVIVVTSRLQQSLRFTPKPEHIAAPH
jgi:hypothetical protein